MAIKIQGSVIIDDSKNIKDNTGFHSDDTNSALRPRSSTGGSYLQRWTGSTWETILEARDGGIFCNRSISVNSPYKYYGDGSSLTGITASNSDTVDGFHASEGFLNSSWCSRIPVVASNGVLEIGKFIDFHSDCASNVDYTYRLDNYSSGNLGFSGSVLVNSNATVSGSVSVTGQATITGNAIIGESSAVQIGYGGGHSFIELRRGSYPFIDFGAESYSDYGVRIAGSGNDLIFDPRDDFFFYGVDTGAEVGVKVLRLNDNKRLIKFTIGSSRRYKTNIENLTSEWFDKIYDIVPVSFNYKEHCIDDNPLMREGNCFKIGVIAEDIAESTPEWVQYGYYEDQYIDNPNPDDPIKKILKEDPERTPLTVNYESIFMCAVGALQELRQRVIDLEEEVQTLKASSQTP